MVVRNLAVDVVEHMGLRDTVSCGGTDPTHDAAKTTEQVTVKSRQSTTGEGELGGTVVGKERVGVLKEGDENEPVVYPTI